VDSNGHEEERPQGDWIQHLPSPCDRLECRERWAALGVATDRLAYVGVQSHIGVERGVAALGAQPTLVPLQALGIPPGVHEYY